MSAVLKLGGFWLILQLRCNAVIGLGQIFMTDSTWMKFVKTGRKEEIKCGF